MVLGFIKTVCFVGFSNIVCYWVLEKGKLITWGSSDDEEQSYVTSGKHGV